MIVISPEIEAQVAWKDIEQVEKERKEEKFKKQKKEKMEVKKQIYWEIAWFYENWYFLNQDEPDPDLFEKIAIDVVKLFEKSHLTSTKLRQYYDIIVNLYNSWIYKTNKNSLRTELNLMLAKANYDKERKNIVPIEFVQFLSFNIKELLFKKDEYDVEDKIVVFKKHFEAVVAYAKWTLKDK